MPNYVRVLQPVEALSKVTHMQSAFPSVGAVEAATGISRHLLRIWERRYGFPQPVRDDGGERLYPPDQVERLRLIAGLLERGHRPGRIVPLPMDALAQLIAETARKPAVGGGVDVDHILQAAAGHGLVELRRRLQEALLRHGLPRFVLDTVRPLVKAIGAACAEGTIDRPQEHLYTEQIDRVLREAMAPLPSNESPRILLATLPPEEHAMGLLMFQALARLEGADAIPLGTALAPDAIARLAAAANADIIVLSFSGAYNADARPMLGELRNAVAPGVEIWCGGAGARSAGRQRTGIRVLGELEDGVEALRAWRAARDAEPQAAIAAPEAVPHEIAASPTAFRRAVQVPLQQALYSYWVKRRGGRAMPRPTEIDMAEIPQLAPITGMIEVIEPGPRFSYGVIGAELAGSFTRQVAGRPLRAAKNSAYGRFLEGIYATAVALRGPIISRGIAYYRNDIRRRFHRVVLPLSSDGGRVDALLYSTVGFAMSSSDPHPPADDILYCDGHIVALPGKG